MIWYGCNHHKAYLTIVKQLSQPIIGHHLVLWGMSPTRRCYHMTPNRITSNVYLTLQSHDAALHCITSNIALYRYSFKAFTLHSWHIYIYINYIYTYALFTCKAQMPMQQCWCGALATWSSLHKWLRWQIVQVKIPPRQWNHNTRDSFIGISIKSFMELDPCVKHAHKYMGT